MEKRITFEIKKGYHLKLLTPEKIKFLASNKNKITKDRNIEKVPNLENTEEVLVHCNFIDNGYQQDSRVLYPSIPKKSLGQLLDISPKKFIFLKVFNREFSYIEVWFTDQNSKLLEIEHCIKITSLVIN